MIASTPTGSDRHPGRVIQVNPTHEMEIVDQMTRSSPLVAVGLSGAGWHPAAWREPSARPKDLLTAGYWRDVIGTAAAAAPVLVTIDDGFGTHPGTVADPDDAHAHTDRVAGRLDSVLIAARVAPQVGGIGILPTVVATHTEPFMRPRPSRLSTSSATVGPERWWPWMQAPTASGSWVADPPTI